MELNEKKWFWDAGLLAGAGLFVAVASLWIYCLPPGLASYRDAGEMACDVYTLGIAHQPGYPLYILAGKLAALALPGNFAFKLNLFSAVCGLAALLALYFQFAARFGVLPALFAALLFSLNFTLQTVSGVSEMYSLNIFFAALLLWAMLSFESSWSRRKIWLTAYLLGLAMTNRMDIVLISPAILISAWPWFRTSLFYPALKTVFIGTLFFMAGFSVYLYLYMRSGANPVFDWSHPAELAAFLAVITRRSYGSTLDLISLNYSPGELFWPNMKYYALHLAKNFNFGLIAAAAGMFSEFTQNRRRFYIVLAIFAVPGPVFIYMANMPPNPHALAIVEPYYLLPDMAVALWLAAGLAFTARNLSRPVPAVAGAAAVFIALAGWQNIPRSCRRDSFAAEDWGRDVLNSVPMHATLVGKKDVQLFTLWYLQTVRGERPDIKIVSQGLSGARWYQNSKRLWQPDLKLFNLNSGAVSEWEKFLKSNPGGVYATIDAELPGGISTRPRGLVNSFSAGREPDLWHYYNFRWLGRSYSDFFSKDLGASYAASIVGHAAWHNNNGGISAEEAKRLRLACIIDPDQPEAELYLGFYYSSVQDWPSAAACFHRSAEVNARLLKLADEYRTLPELKESLARSGAYAWLNYGVALEKTGQVQGAEEAYKQALAADRNMADAHYNMAILYWNKDSRRVYEELSQALKINPGHRQAAYYLSRINYRGK